jgi:hypothetical protein
MAKALDHFRPKSSDHYLFLIACSHPKIQFSQADNQTVFLILQDIYVLNLLSRQEGLNYHSGLI